MIDPTALHVRRMRDDDASAVATWRCTGDWSVYNLASEHELVDELACYHSVFLDGELIGFFCIGDAARVLGLPEDAETIDVGVGMNPKLVGQGFGQSFGHAVLSYLEANYPNQRLRAVVQAWKRPQLATCTATGIREGRRADSHPRRPIGGVSRRPQTRASRKRLT